MQITLKVLSESIVTQENGEIIYLGIVFNRSQFRIDIIDSINVLLVSTTNFVRISGADQSVGIMPLK